MSIKKKLNIEDSLNHLESLIEKMESNNGSLEENLSCFEEGMGLIVKCQKEIKLAKQKVYNLVKNSKDEFEIKENSEKKN